MDRPTTIESIPSVASGPDDFLYHLYRGSEMLMSDQVVEAKGELEKALALQPQDAKSQDLLAGVYFRLGLYPRAIEIWQQLVRIFPRDPTLRVNLSLALFKTGQADEALHHVHEALNIQPEHSKAWGYMGLIHWRRGQLEEARTAFLRGGQASMARRMEGELERLGRGSGEYRAVPPRPEDEAELVGSVGTHPVATTQDELDAIERRRQGRADLVDTASSALERLADDPHALSLDPSSPVASEHVLGGRRERTTLSWDALEPGAETVPPKVIAPAVSASLTPTLSDVVSGWTAVFPEREGVMLGAQGELLLHTEHYLYVRSMDLTAVRGDLNIEPVMRRARGEESDEVLGGEAPILRWKGPVSAVAHPREEERFFVLDLAGGMFFVRESLLVAFDDTLAFESAALPLGEATGVFTQLHGEGRVALSLPEIPTGVAVNDETIRVAPQRLVGWTGRLFPSDEADQLVFRGQGVVLVS